MLPLALYLRVGLEGIGWDIYEEYFWEHRLVRFDYPYIGLPALDAEQYVNQDNWLGVALSALMKVPKERRIEMPVGRDLTIITPPIASKQGSTLRRER